jgi:mRNA-degrading endonuclease toxin of MazEF toxin-antitoxin module
MTFGDIVLVPFPFADKDQSELHPAVVITEIHLGNSSDLILSMISSNISRCTNEDVLIDDKDEEFAVTKLAVKSCIKTGKVATVSRIRIQRKLGRLGSKHHQEFANKLRARLKL